MGDRDGALPASQDRAAGLRPQPPSAFSQSSIPSARPLYDLPPKEWNFYTNHGYLKLPKAKGASDPFLYMGGPAPVPDETKISLWFKGRDYLRGYWCANTAKPSIWMRAPIIFRIRDVPPVQTKEADVGRFIEWLTGHMLRRQALAQQSRGQARAQHNAMAVECEIILGAAEALLTAQGTSAFGQDPKGLEAKPAGPVPAGNAP